MSRSVNSFYIEENFLIMETLSCKRRGHYFYSKRNKEMKKYVLRKKGKKQNHHHFQILKRSHAHFPRLRKQELLENEWISQTSLLDKKKLFLIGASCSGRCSLGVEVNGCSSRNPTSGKPSLLGSRRVSKWRSLNESHSGEQLAILMTHSHRRSPTPPPVLPSTGSLHGNTFSFLSFFRSVLQDELISNCRWMNKASVQIKMQRSQSQAPKWLMWKKCTLLTLDDHWCPLELWCVSVNVAEMLTQWEMETSWLTWIFIYPLWSINQRQ